MRYQTLKTVVTLILLSFFASQRIIAVTKYVGTTGTPSGNYFTDIQSAVDASSAGDLVLVSNGVYSVGERVTPGHDLTNRVVITKNITVRSVNGPKNTIILGKEAPGGSFGPGAVRCVYMESGTISGFTISNGNTLTSGSDIYEKFGGGIWLTNGCIVTNCTIIGNNADLSGGGAYCSGGSLFDCTISQNSAQDSGGGVYCNVGSTVTPEFTMDWLTWAHTNI